jgi:predicted ArsR family transcriptional regulator
MKTTKEIAELLDVDTTTAYGLLGFMAAKGLIETGKAARVEGARGKAATTYDFSAESIAKLNKCLLETCCVGEAKAASCEVPAAFCCAVPNKKDATPEVIG